MEESSSDNYSPKDRGVVLAKQRDKESSKVTQVAALTVGALGIVAGVRGVVVGHSNGDNEKSENSTHTIVLPEQTATATSKEAVAKNPELFDIEFHDLDSDQGALARQEVDMYKGKIAEKATYVQDILKSL
jgi:hypothetical protein